MSGHCQPLRHRLAVTAGYLVSILGGGFLGLASCGGYAWHEQAFAALLVVLAVLIAAQGRSANRWVRIVLALGTFPTFVLAQALSAPFYPSTPAASEYWQKVWIAIQYGPC